MNRIGTGLERRVFFALLRLGRRVPGGTESWIGLMIFGLVGLEIAKMAGNSHALEAVLGAVALVGVVGAVLTRVRLEWNLRQNPRAIESFSSLSWHGREHKRKEAAIQRRQARARARRDAGQRVRMQKQKKSRA
jgi:hypothetical protein